MEGEARVRPVPVSLMAGERSALDAYKKALLVKEHERECRHVQEVSGQYECRAHRTTTADLARYEEGWKKEMDGPLLQMDSPLFVG